MTNEKLINLLLSENGYVSGEKIAKETGVTRNCVWKKIKELKNEGYDIVSVPNKGYLLKNSGNNFSAAIIKSRLNKDIEVECEGTVTSTNTILKGEAATSSEKKEKILIANRQTEGRGRLGKSFFSPEETGMYMSMLLYPKFKATESYLITAAAAVAVCRAIEKISSDKKPKIKWVNDVFINSKKVCGILTEGATDFESGGLEYAVVGIGVNLFTSEKIFPGELKNIAGSIFEKAPSPETRNEFAAAVINEFFAVYENGVGFMKEYKERSFLIGRRVISALGGGVVEDITDGAELVLRLDSGEIKTISAGEISVKEDKNNEN